MDQISKTSENIQEQVYGLPAVVAINKIRRIPELQVVYDACQKRELT